MCPVLVDRRWSGSSRKLPCRTQGFAEQSQVWLVRFHRLFVLVRWCSSRSMRSSRVSRASSNSSAEWSWDSSVSRLFSRGYWLRSVVGLSSGSACSIGADVGALPGHLQQQVAEQETGERPVRPDAAGVGEAAVVQGVQERFHPPQAAQRWPHPRRGGWPGRDEREHLRVREGDPPDPVGEALQVVLPGVGGQVHVRVPVEVVDDQFHDAVEQVFPAVHVVVQRHCLHTELHPRGSASSGAAGRARRSG